ncbi:MAG: SprT-like domain-containing protein [Flavobacteriaceae bacterium]|nr:SprT-like domain-containing protein [Flavobacteriaceae bacterium]
MKGKIKNFIPEGAWERVQSLLNHDKLEVKVRNKRKTKHGDYRPLPNGQHQITVNNNLNPYRFLITLIHEIAHFEAFMKYGHRIKPHGKEWKMTFQRLMLPFLNPDVFPEKLLPLLAQHFKNPKASSNTDAKLYYALSEFDAPNNNSLIFQLPENTQFIAQNGKTYVKGQRKTKRFQCVEVSTGRLWSFDPNAEVRSVEKKIT